MPGPADFIQQTVHAVEAGRAAKWIKRGLAVVVVVGLAVFYMMHEFRGLATSQAMDQAQIGRNIASRQPWRTDVVRPRAIGQLQENGKPVAQNIWYDTYHAPLPPLVDAIVIFPFKSVWKMTARDLVYALDKLIAFSAVVFFLGSLVFVYLTANRLFDQRLAVLATAMVVLCDLMWQYAISGLPQMLMLFLFSGTLYVLVRAVQGQYAGGRVGLWLALAGVGFGLLALTHALTIWIFVAALVYSIFFFRPRGWAAVIMLSAFVVLYTPWLVRNFVLTGNPGGVAVYSFFDEINHSEVGHMRRVELDLQDVTFGHFKRKFINNLTEQMGDLLGLLGWSAVALVFFVSLLHVFKRPETANVRWLVLSMWIGAVIGMMMWGINPEQGVAANQLYLLFIPILTSYGLAYLLVQWNRLEIEFRLARIGFIGLLFVVACFPMVFTVLAPTFKPSVRWPPYVPPYISIINDWMKPEEVTASDMPWAVSWYADRRSLYLPETIKAFTEFNDYNVLNAPVTGLYLTPISGSQNNLSDILKGEYQDWAAVILRSVDLQKFPLKWAHLLGLENECVFFSDHDRQRLPPL